MMSSYLVWTKSNTTFGTRSWAHAFTFILVPFLKICIKKMNRLGLHYRVASLLTFYATRVAHSTGASLRAQPTFSRRFQEEGLELHCSHMLKHRYVSWCCGYAVSGLGRLCSSIDLRAREHNVLSRMDSRSSSYQSSLPPGPQGWRSIIHNDVLTFFTMQQPNATASPSTFS